MAIQKFEQTDRRGRKYFVYTCGLGHWHRNYNEALRCVERDRAKDEKRIAAAMKRGVKFPTYRTEVFPGRKSFRHNGETFTLLTRRWDIEKARQIIAEKKRKVVVQDVSSGWGWLGSEPGQGEWIEQPDGSKKFTGSMGIIRINWEYVSKITPERMKEPLIIGTIKLDKKEKGNIILDGWHRLARARQLGIKELPVYVLTLKETDSITMPVYR